MENTKLNKTASILDRILKILQGFMIAAFFVCLIFIPLVAIFGVKMIASASNLDIGELEMHLTGDMDAFLISSNLKTSLIVMLLGTMLEIAAGWYCLRVLREILAPMKSGSPFAAGVSGKIRKLGWTVLIGGFLVEVGKLISSIFELRLYDLDKLLNSQLVSAHNFTFNISLWFLFTAFVLFFLSYIFRCGETLQKESDETL